MDDALRAVDTVFGIPGGLLPAGGFADAKFPAYANLGTPADSTLHEILGLIIPGGGGQTLQTDEWLMELETPLTAGTKLVTSAFAGVNGTAGSPPLDLWAADNNFRLFAAGELVSRGGSVAVLVAVHSGTPDGITFNRDLGSGDQVILQRTVFN